MTSKDAIDILSRVRLSMSTIPSNTDINIQYIILRKSLIRLKIDEVGA
jgi:hypothetical protein